MTLLLLFLPATAYAACTGPAGVAGEFRFNNDRAALQYCDADNWVMAGLGSYLPVPVAFDGTNDYLREAGGAGGINIANTKQVTGSLWLRNSQATGTSSFIYQTQGAGFRLEMDSATRKFEVIGQSAGGILILNHLTTNALNDGRWHHVLFSYDLTDSAKAHLYIDGTADASTPGTYTDDLMDINGFTVAVGADHDGTDKYEGDLADVWIDFGTYVDLSNANNRRRFISDNGMPMYPGEDGSLLTGSKPEVFFSGDVDTWHTNRGTAGGFTENGAIETSVRPIPLPAASNSTIGLLGHWKLDETSGTTAADSSGNGYDGTLTNFTGTPWVEGKMNGAVAFDGSDDVVVVSDNAFDNMNEFTACAWVYRDGDGPASWVNLVAKTSDGSNGWNLYATNHSETVGFYAPNTEYVQPGSILKLNTWVHLCGSYDGTAGDLKLYSNGQLSASGSGGPTTTDDASYNLTIGNDDGGVYEFGGDMDDVRIYNRVLAEWEIAALYSGTCSGPAGTGGTMLYNTDYKVMQYCNGAEWVAMSKIGGTGGTGCASPVGSAGEIRYDSASNVMQYCNIEDWVNIGKVTPPSDGLVAHWRLDETSGATIADDTGTHNGTWTDGGDNDVTGETVTGKSGNALHLDGVDDLITVPDNAALDITGPLTLAAWVNFDSLSVGSDENRLFYKGAGNYNFNLYTLDVKNGLFNMTFNATDPDSLCDASTEYCVDSATTVSTGTWYHVVATYDGSIGRMYINGTLDNTNTFTHTATANSNTLVIGGRSGSIDMLDGIIDDVRIYNRALTATEVTSLYNATR